MKKILFILPLLVGCVQAQEPEEIPQWSAVGLLREINTPNSVGLELSDFDKLVMAICFTESRFRADAIGTQDDAGIMQIRPIYVAEVNRLYGTDYKPEDAFDIDKSLELYRLMQAHYNPNNDIETAIRYHNRSESYKRVVLENLELVNRYELLRSKLCSGKY